jgi:DNA mismatch endonuclease, patch repair protein
MADNLTLEQRRRNMSRIRSRNTSPEKIVRSLIHRGGYRFTLHEKKLPGKPDIVLPRHRKIVLVHGCFWHMHSCKRGNVFPKTNEHYWTTKRQRNVERDHVNEEMYEKAGWKTLIVWECEIKDLETLSKKIFSFLNNS